jgi:hypothetical protein
VHARRKPGWKSNLLLLAVSLIVATAGAEIVLRLLGIPRRYREHSHPPQFQARPETGYLYVNLPSSRIRFDYDGDPRGAFTEGHVDHWTNALGFRGEEFTAGKPPGAARFVFLGDSFTFGEGVRQSDTLPEQFRRAPILRQVLPGREIEALNLGVGGYNTVQEAALLREVGVALRPDWVIVIYCLNDAEPALFARTAAGDLVRRDREAGVPENLSTPAIPSPYGWLHLTQLAYSTAAQRRLTRRTIEHYRSLYREGNPGWDEARRALEEIGAIGRASDVRVTVAIFPLLFQLDSGYPFRDLHDHIAAAARAAGLDCLDLLPAFEAHSGPELWVHPTDQHPNEIALRLAAGRLAEHVATAGEVSPAKPRP